MNESKKQGEQFTPGPWIVDYSGPARLAITAQGEAIALGNLQCEDGDKDEANMQLMAAAPEMLEVLDVMARLLEYNRGHATADLNAYAEKARGIIAKARGAV